MKFTILLAVMVTGPAPAPMTFGLEPVPVIAIDTDYRSPMFGLPNEAATEPVSTAPVAKYNPTAFAELLKGTPEPPVQEEIAPVVVEQPIIVEQPIVVAQPVEYVQERICENGVCRIINRPRRQIVKTRTVTQKAVGWGVPTSGGCWGGTKTAGGCWGGTQTAGGSWGAGGQVANQSFFAYETSTSSLAQHLSGPPHYQNVAGMSEYQMEQLHNQLHAGERVGIFGRQRRLFGRWRR